MNELETPIGNKEPSKLSAGSVIVKEITIETPKEGSKAKIVKFHVQHPDKEELITLSEIKVKKAQGNNETLKLETLWWNTDEDGNVRKGSAVAQVMSHYGKKTLKEFENTSIATESKATGYLAIKAY